MKQILLPLFDEAGLRVADFFYDPATDVIYFMKSVKGQKVKFSTSTKRPNIARARRVANEELSHRLAKKKSRIHPLIKDELPKWLKVKESEGPKYDTLNNIRRAVRSLEEFWGPKFPHEITRDTLVIWYEWWAENRPGLQMENDIKYLRNFSRYLAQKIHHGVPLLPAVPPIKDPNYKAQRAARKKKKENIFSASDFRKIYDTAPGLQEQILVLIMYTMATRITETLTMRFGHEIVLDEPMPEYRWTVGQNKADLWGRHALHVASIELLKELRDQRRAQGTNLLFPQKFNNQAPLKEQQLDWDEWRERADIGWHWTPHTFRHTCLSNLFNDGKNPQALILKLYRVSLATALEHYIKPTNDGIMQMRDAIQVRL